jgi:hypothetical protein
VDEIADAAAIRRRIIGAEHVDLGALSGRRLDRDLEQMRGADGGQSDPCFRIGAGDVEVAHHHIAHAMGGSDVMQHDLAHQLR